MKRAVIAGSVVRELAMAVALDQARRDVEDAADGASLAPAPNVAVEISAMPPMEPWEEKNLRELRLMCGRRQPSGYAKGLEKRIRERRKAKRSS